MNKAKELLKLFEKYKLKCNNCGHIILSDYPYYRSKCPKCGWGNMIGEEPNEKEKNNES